MIVAVGILLLAAWFTTSRFDGHDARRHRTPRLFGGLGVAWSLRARHGSLELGRWVTGGWWRTPLRLGVDAPGSVLVVGPTQSGKTTALAAPMLLSWPGPVLAASVKGDLAGLTARHRRTLGRVQIVAPGEVGSAVWDPVRQASSVSAARALARDLTVGTGAGGASGDQEFWAALSAKLLAPLLLAANRSHGSIATVTAWVDRRDVSEAASLLDPLERDALLASFSRDERTLGSLLATVEAALDPFVAGTDVVDPSSLLAGPNTCYLSAPLHDQRRHRPLFAGLVRQVLAAAAECAQRGEPSGLLVLLDEAASIAPVEELDQIAATCQGQGITLVTVWQDLAQISARYGPRARTVVNNHTSRVLLGGLADPTITEWLPTLTGTDRPRDAEARSTSLTAEELRRWPRGAAVLISGRLPPVRLRLVAWNEGRRSATSASRRSVRSPR
jgi:type IV secretory pathway TraG/TraD family ATPase VirD4